MGSSAHILIHAQGKRARNIQTHLRIPVGRQTLLSNLSAEKIILAGKFGGVCAPRMADWQSGPTSQTQESDPQRAGFDISASPLQLHMEMIIMPLPWLYTAYLRVIKVDGPRLFRCADRIN